MLTLLQDVAEEVINPRFRTLEDDQIAEKNPGDLVTVADREAEVMITAALRAAYPDALVLGEEAEATDDTLVDRFDAADHAFTVDPVDGTKNFVKGSRDHAVMASEIRGGEVVRAWIWQPQHETAYVAERGAGAYRDGERLRRPPVERAAARRHLPAALDRPGARRAQGAGPDLGLLRGRLPQAGRGRGRLRALPQGQALGPRPRARCCSPRRAASSAPSTASPTTRSGASPSGWSRRPTGRRTTWCRG